MKKHCLAWLLLVVLLLSSCGDLGKDSGNGTPEPESPSVESEDTSDSSDDGDGEDSEDSEDGEDSESDFEEPSGSQTPDNNNPGSSYTYTNLSKTMWAKTNLNVRSEPSKIGEVIGYLAPNEEVKVTGQCNETGWYRIEYKGKVGYASNSYLLDQKPVVEEEKPEITMYATANVNVRSKPNTSGTVLGVLTTGTSVLAYGPAENGWIKVLYKEKVGYVSEKYLTVEEFMMHPEITAEDVVIPELNGTGPVIVIDAGHQEFTNANLEPNGPGSTTMKKKVSRGTRGCVSDWWEYELNLVVAMKLKEELIARGYQVVMIRETHAINISNIERAKVANNLKADAFIRIHANGSNNSAEKGAFTICQTPQNPYIGDKYDIYRKLSDCILDGFAESTGCVKKEVWETDTMTGINWAEVPTTILEMGHMTNPEEDALMATEEYQDKMVDGIANGLDKYFEEINP